MINAKLETQASLVREVLNAVALCADKVEEQGGIVLYKDNDFVFVKVKNIYENTPTAAGLYETDQDDLRDLVFSKVKDGWKFYSSFHTHPMFQATPSGLDLAKLFQGFKYNIIYSHLTSTFSFSSWENDQIYTAYVPVEKLKELAKNDI